MKLHMYEHFSNYGDVLNKHIWPFYLGSYLNREDNILMFGIGTLLGQKISHQGKVIVCGSGCGYEPDLTAVKDYKIFFVRGPNSASLLGLPEDMAITDPAILVDECFPPEPRRDRVVFMPHLETSRSPLWRRICGMAGIHYVDPMDDAKTISAHLSSARLVIAEAMHGAIVADAYRVPWIPVATSTRINQFKWNDWAASLKIQLNFRTLPLLGVSDVFRCLTGDAKTARTLHAHLPGSGNMPTTAQKGLQARLFNGLNLLYSNLLPRGLRYRIEHNLFWKIGPIIDGWIDEAASRGWRFHRLELAAAQLQSLTLEPGTLSQPAVQAAQKARVKAKLEEVRQYLEIAGVQAI